jgi:hypothetical protein
MPTPTTSEVPPTVTAASSRTSVRPTAEHEGAPEGLVRPDRRVTWTVNIALWLGAMSVAASAGIHLHLWLTGYRNIATIGPMFLGQAVVGFALAVALAWTRLATLAIVSGLFLLGTIGGLLISAWFGLFGFHDSFDAPYAHLSLIVEGFGAVILFAGAGFQLVTRNKRQRGAD